MRNLFFSRRSPARLGALIAALVAAGPVRADVLADRAALTTAPPPAVAPAVVDAAASALTQQDYEFLDLLQERTFRYFWETTNAKNGLTPDRWPSKSFSSVAAVGFGLTAYGVGVERGWISREQAVERTLTTLEFFWNAPQGPEADAAGHHGFFYHFLDMDTGRRHQTCELSSIDTALLMAGVLFSGEYFDGADPREARIRDLADKLYRRVDWAWMQPRPPLVCMSWTPEAGFGVEDYQGYNESMLMYVMALGSPTHPIDAGAWGGYTRSYTWGESFGQEHLLFGPLFGHQYSHVWIDFRGIRDDYMRRKGIDYFENSRRAVLSQRAYAMANPDGWKGYGENVWGLTASDGPALATVDDGGRKRTFYTYSARGQHIQQMHDDGVIAPTAAGGSIPFAPAIAVAALRAMVDLYGEHVFSQYGFLDSFNPSFLFEDVELKHGKVVPGLGWFNSDYLGIDQGPILLMAENARTELVWRAMHNNAYLHAGLKRAGFSGGWLDQRAVAVNRTSGYK